MDPTPSPGLDEVRQLSGILDAPPYTHITFVLVAKDEEHRLPGLLDLVRPYFERMVVAVQTSSDSTRDIARAFADVVIDDDDHGFGDASMRLLQNAVTTRWAFRVDADEEPTHELLTSLSSATWWAERQGAQGIWLRYRSWVEWMEYEQQHSHLRLWENQIPWPPLLHSRPNPPLQSLWSTGHILHSKSLDEFVVGYLSYLRAGRDNAGWTEHNLMQLQSVCRAAADRYGWPHVTGRPWWPEVVEEAFDGKDPTTV